MSSPRATASAPRERHSLAGWIGAAVIGAVLLLLYLAFRGAKEELPRVYGKRRGANAAESVNGTAVLARLFEKAGHRVTTFKELNRRIDEYDTVVWVPDDFGAPSDEARQFLENWLASGPKRTLVYVGRDYDAASEYWKQMLSHVEDPRYDEYLRRAAHAKSEFDARRVQMPDYEYAGWFTFNTDPPARTIPDLDGPWASGIDASQTNIELAGRLDIPSKSDLGPQGEGAEIEILLQSENDILAHSFAQGWWKSSRVIVVANGSFLLNLPLVNKEHRKLAGNLIEECGGPGDVAFVESGPNGIRVRQGTPARDSAHALHLFTIWPVSFIFIHFAALGIAYCIARFPIFGRPHHLPSGGRSDFGQHVAALGELLARTKDTFFAESRIRTYQAQSKRSSGQSHRTPAHSALAAEVVEIVPFQKAPETPAKYSKPNA